MQHYVLLPSLVIIGRLNIFLLHSPISKIKKLNSVAVVRNYTYRATAACRRSWCRKKIYLRRFFHFYLYLIIHILCNCPDSSVCMVTGYGLDSRDFTFGMGKNSFTLHLPDWLWCPNSLLSSEYRGLFLRGKAAGVWSWPLTSILCRGKEEWSYTCHPHCFFIFVIYS
jgi:hypothetical protein